MFWRKKEEGQEKLSGPKTIPEQVRKYLVNRHKKDAGLLTNMKAVLRKHPDGDNAYDVRLFDESEAIVKNVTVKDYTSLDENPGLIFYEGWYDKSGKVELNEKKELKAAAEVPIASEGDILRKIEGLTQPGQSVFFYLGGSPAYGGPFGRGAAVIELNPKYPGEKQKKYIISVANVDGLEPVGKREKMFDSDKTKEIAKWVKERHYKPVSY
ncbi:MAG: hypothetical protein Q7R57_04995 [Dehalococcoidales bacterium]|nr:hypothetical protein [Dehalococcoidales bacterium]